MSNYRRNKVQGGTYFFTVNLWDIKQNLLVEHIELLRNAIRKTKRKKAFHIDAWVVLPDHMHCIWTLPENDADYSGRWREIKKSFTKALPNTEYRSPSRLRNKERGV